MNQAKGLKVTCLLCYCSEGDNIADAFQLAEATSKILKLNPDSFQGEFLLSSLICNFNILASMCVLHIDSKMKSVSMTESNKAFTDMNCN